MKKTWTSFMGLGLALAMAITTSPAVAKSEILLASGGPSDRLDAVFVLDMAKSKAAIRVLNLGTHEEEIKSFTKLKFDKKTNAILFGETICGHAKVNPQYKTLYNVRHTGNCLFETRMTDAGTKELVLTVE